MFANDDEFMQLALGEAKASLKEGNNGFGAVIVKAGIVIAQAHDQEESAHDPTSHAELNVIRLASQTLRKNLAGCALLATHEPCPMCATAIVWSGIRELAYGYSIRQALAQGRKRIDLTCRELFARAGVEVVVHDDVMSKQCAVLYRRDVRRELKRLRNAKALDLEQWQQELTDKRRCWYEANRHALELDQRDLLAAGYELLLRKLQIRPEDARVVKRTDTQLVLHSKNFCPTLEACRLLDLDTREICRALSEKPTDALLKQLNGKLRFSRNYERLRPHSDYCEEIISLAD